MSGQKEISAGFAPPATLSRTAPAVETVATAHPIKWSGTPVQLSTAPGEPTLEVASDKAERLTEEMRVVKRRLLGMQRSANKPRGNIFMVASALPGDGKSFIAWNLAKSLAADQDLEVVLIDGDFRKPHLTHSFGLAEEPGFLEVMAGKIPLSEAGHPTGTPRLTFIAAGTENERANERLASRSAQTLIDNNFANKSGRIVVFDSAPILRASESQVLAQSVGKVLLVVRASHTPKKAVEEAVQVIGGAENCALLLNDADVPPLARYSSSRYGYGYGYGHRYGK